MNGIATLDAEGEQVKVGDIVQIDTEADVNFGGCLLTVTDAKGWGVQGFVTAPAPGAPSLYYYRAESKSFRRVGRAVFVVPEIG